MYMGKRNGTIQRWDLRQPSSNPELIVNMSKKSGAVAGGAPVQHLRTLHGYGLLVETMRGDVSGKLYSWRVCRIDEILPTA